MSELVREALRRYELGTVSAERERSALGLALEALRKEARRQGTDRLTDRQVQAEVTGARRRRRAAGTR